MAEEFQESDVIFTDDYDPHQQQHNAYFSYQEMVLSTQGQAQAQAQAQARQQQQHHHGGGGGGVRLGRNKRKKKKGTPSSCSLPVNINIPDNIFLYVDADEFEEEYEDGEITPPHVIVERRIEGKMAFSVCTGKGRTLKGRDLSQVRNSILRMTGFLET